MKRTRRRSVSRTQQPSAGPATKSGKFRFVVDSALLFQLGEELVNKRSVALAELIKNAYDADATRVTVSFKKVRGVGGEILVSDDGNGMTLARVEESWMRIATTEKVTDPFSERFRRPRTGAKGVGRFAARRLAKELLMTSVAFIKPGRPRVGREETVVRFKWDEFKPGTNVQQTPVSFRRRLMPPAPEGRGTGVTLQLRPARDAWTDDDFRALQRDLQKLISPRIASGTPRGGERDPGFVVRIEAPEFPGFEGEIEDTFLSHALGVLEGELDKHGRAHYRLKFRDRRSLEFSPRTTAFPQVGAAAFTVHFFVYKRDFFAGLPINTREAQQRGREEGGIHVYVDRFRVPPYGDPGDDWLQLDEHRGRRVTDVPEELAKAAAQSTRPMLFLPGNNQLFGRVDLSRVKNPLIRQTLNRERLIENDSYLQLRHFVRLGVDWMTVCYAREFAADREATRQSRDDPLSLLSRARERFETASRDVSPDQRAEILQAIDLATRTVEEHREELIGELAMLRILASTGTMIVVFEHQLVGTLRGLREVHSSLVRLAGDHNARNRDRVAAELTRLDRWIDTAQHQGELLGLLIARKSRTRRQRLAARPIVESVIRAFASYASDYGIEVENSIPGTLRTPPMFEAELTTIFVNLLTNAFKAVRDQPARRVMADGERTPSGVVIRVHDTGVGLARADWQEYFKPFVGDSEPDPLLGEGTGLGLKIVKDFVDVYGGQARFIEPTTPWHTCIQITLPDE